MEVKKNPKADLESKKGIFVQLGFVLALALILGAFEMSSKISKAQDMEGDSNIEIEEEIIPVTRQDQPPPPPPPPPPQMSEVMEIVEDDVEILDEMEIEDAEVDQDTEIEVADVEVEEEAEEANIFFIVEKMPLFPGGDLALRKYIAKNVKYPTIARENDIKGKVFIRFCVTKTGDVNKVTVLRGVDPLLDKEAIRVVKNLPKWSPGEQRGKKVNVWYTVPINFQLQ